MRPTSPISNGPAASLPPAFLAFSIVASTFSTRTWLSHCVRRRSLHRLAEAAVSLSARRDHRVIHLAGLEHLRIPAEQLRVEVLRLLGVRRNLFVPDELADRRCGSAHLFHLLVGVTFH